MKSTEAFKKAAIRGGIPENDEALITFLSQIPESLEVPDTIAAALGSLMSEADAKVNPAVKSHFVRAALDTMDNKLSDLVESLGLSAEHVEALKNEKNTYAKPELLKGLLTDALKNAGKKTDSPEAKKQIEELTNALKAAESKATEVETRLLSEFENERLNNGIQSVFNSYQWSEAYPQTLRGTVAETLLKQKLATLGAKVKRGEDGQPTLVHANDETLPFRVNNEALTFKQFADGLMAENNLVKTNNAAGSTPPATSQTTAAASAPATTSKAINRTSQFNQEYLEAAGVKL